MNSRCAALRQGAAPEPEGHVYLYPGRIHISAEPSTVRTILGSCVSVCLFDPRLAVGGINHFLLPRGPVSRGADPRYGVSATALLVREMQAHGAAIERLEAKLFGGGAVMAALNTSRFSLAADNVAVARIELGRLGIPILAENTGGRGGRKLIYETHTGAAWVKELSS